MIELKRSDDVGPGSATWVAERLTTMRSSVAWGSTAACVELIGWVYCVARYRAIALGLRGTELDDVVQDSMIRIAQALERSVVRRAEVDNPAAMLERITSRAVGESYHAHRMCGFAGAAPNGHNRDVDYPVRVSAGSVTGAFEQAFDGASSLQRAVDDLAELINDWSWQQLGVCLTKPAGDALVYVLDRLVAGVNRITLVTGGHSRLRVDPAMRHLGFSGDQAAAFGLWLLGRNDASRRITGVLDAALGDSDPGAAYLERWRREAIQHDFGSHRNDSSERLSA